MTASRAWVSQHAALDCCDIVTTGRRTGRPHEIEIWFGVIGGSMFLISGNGPGADWYRNMLHDPRVTVKLAGRELVGRGRPVSDPEERIRVGDLMGTKYVWNGDSGIGLTYRAWCYDVPVMGIEFDPAT